MSSLSGAAAAFLREQARVPLNLALLILVPVFFVLIFASVLDDFAAALGGEIAQRAASSISAGWAAAFLCGSLAFFQVVSSREADRRLAHAGFGALRVATARMSAALVLGGLVSLVAYLTLWLRAGVEHPPHAAASIFVFAAIYIGIGALVGAMIKDPLSGSLLIVLVFSLDVFSGPAMTSGGDLSNLTPTRDAAELLIAAGGGRASDASEWIGAGLVATVGLLAAVAAFWLSARSSRAP